MSSASNFTGPSSFVLKPKTPGVLKVSAAFRSSSVAPHPAGSTPPKYLPTMAVVRETRLPRSLARSVLMVWISSSLEKLPSEPKGNVRIRKNRRASTPNFSARIYGSTTLPLDLDILPPSSSSQPWPNTCLGTGSPRLISMAGQMMEWNRTISLPTMLTPGHQPLS